MHTSDFLSSLRGNVSMGFMQATPGEMKSFKSSADRIALMAAAEHQSKDAMVVLETSHKICSPWLFK